MEPTITITLSDYQKLQEDASDLGKESRAWLREATVKYVKAYMALPWWRRLFLKFDPPRIANQHQTR